jgi:GNAT superfamily N-acetyltransferase
VLDVRLGPATWADADVRRLTAAQQAELRVRYEGVRSPGRRPRPRTSPSSWSPATPVARRWGAARCARWGDGVAEIKRMYVVPAARGRGLSKLVLAGLEAAARDRGWTTLRLETGPRQPEAVALYEGAGYRPIAAFGPYADDADDSLFYERVIDPG